MKRTLLITEHCIELAGMGQPLDGVFDSLYEAYYRSRALPWPQLSAAAQKYFDADPTSSTAHNAYFENFSIIWGELFDARRYDDAERLWYDALIPALHWEDSHPGVFLHKGTPYYFWAMTLLIKGDIDRGYLLMHQAVEEDLRTSNQAAPDSPAYAFVSLDYEKTDQAFRTWVQAQAEFLANLLQDYDTTHQRTLTLDDVKHRFLEVPPSTDTLFLFTYTLDRFRNLTRLPEHTVNNPFAGQLRLNLLFDITLIVDSTIKPKSNSRKFIDHLEFLLKKAGSPLTSAQLRDINSQFKDGFDKALDASLDGTLSIEQTSPLNRLQCDVALTYGLRNHSAHSTSTANSIRTRFDNVQLAVFRTFFATIDQLYR